MHTILQPHTAVVVLAALSVVAAVVAVRTRRTALKVAAAVFAGVFLVPACLLALALHPEWIDPRHHTYKSLYRDLSVGMTREEVFAALARHYPPNGPRQRPRVLYDEPERLGFFMNPEGNREPNCEGIFLELDGRRVTTKKYSAD